MLPKYLENWKNAIKFLLHHIFWLQVSSGLKSTSISGFRWKIISPLDRNLKVSLFTHGGKQKLKKEPWFESNPRLVFGAKQQSTRQRFQNCLNLNVSAVANW